MARNLPDWRLRLDAYPVRHPITVRVGDLDANRHVSAIRIGEFYEEARASFYLTALKGVERPRILVAQILVRYLGEALWPGALEVGTGIARLGGSSFEMHQGLFSDGVCIGVCETVLVGTEQGTSAPLRAPIRAALEAMLLEVGA